MDFTAALTEAVEAGDAVALAALFAAGADPASLDEDGTPFVLAVADGGDVDLVRAFLDAGLPPDADCGDPAGSTALICAARGGHRPLTEFLLARGADPNRVERGDVEAGSPLTWTMELPDPTPLVEVLLAGGADPDVSREDGWTPLMLAASFGHTEAARRLLAAGAHVNAAAHDGELNALAAARYRSRDEVIALLLEHGAEEAVDPDVVRLARSEEEIARWLTARADLPEPSGIDAGTASLSLVVDDIAAWFAEHAPPAAVWIEEARGAADPAAITAAEAELGTRFPAGYRAYLRLFGATDGLNIAEYDGLSLARALDRWRGLEKLRREGTFATWAPREVRHDNGLVRYTWWHPAWFPLAEDGGGNLYCVDLDPADRGTVGQVISWEVHGGPAGPILPSVESYLLRYLDRCREGEYDFNPATGHAYGG